MPEIPFRKIVAIVKRVLPKSFWAGMPISIKQLVYLFEAIFASVYFGSIATKSRFLSEAKSSSFGSIATKIRPLLKVIGVTGTDGKTTTAYFIYSILKAAGKKVALISTIGAKVGDKDIDTGFHVTTPDSWELQKFIKRIADEKNEYLVLEVTSHALDQHRVFGIPFEVGVLTNITHEHLDYHRTFENYVKSKAKLFQLAKVSILNKDDPSFERLSKVAKQFFWYSRSESVDLTPSGNLRGLSVNLGGLDESELKKHAIQIKLLGDYNWSNALAAALTARSLNIGWEDIKAGIEAVSFIPGRMEEIVNNKGFRIFVDFAHTPNALEQVLKLSSKFNPPAGGQISKLIVVFGCAGERDKTKRPIMGEIAGRLSDISILTAEDPRTEDLNQILGEIAQGVRKYLPEVRYHDLNHDNKIENKGGKYFIKIPDRKKAIELALQVAKNGDCVIITGKGHERSMCFGEMEYPWSDQEIVKNILKGV